MVRQTDGQEECVEGAVIKLLQGDQEISRTQSDAFGDFKIGRLSRGLGPVTLRVEMAMVVKTLDLDLAKSVYVGCVEV